MTDFGARSIARLQAVRKAQGGNITPEQSGTLLSEYFLEELALMKKNNGGKMPRTRDVFFDALCEVDGCDPLQLPRAKAKQVAVALRDIREVTPNLTVEDIRARAAEYKRKHPTWSLTVTALAKHWGNLGGGGQTRAAKRDIYQEPPGWQEVAKKIYSVDFAGKAWLDLGPDLRQRILAEIVLKE